MPAKLATLQRPGGTLTRFADAGQMRAWIERAVPGQVLIYAEGPSLGDGRHEAVLVARSWADSQRAEIKQERCDSGFRYLARKREPRPEPAVSFRLPRDLAGSPGGEMLRLLAELAEAGLPCPSYRDLAEQLGLRNLQQARYQLERLEAAGRIAVAREGDHRTVTITETGLATAGPVTR